MRVSAWAELVGLPILWGAGVLGALQLQHVATDAEHAICGPWGCGPTASALLAMHVGWLAALGPPLLYLPFRTGMSRVWIDRLAFAVLGLGIVGMVIIAARQWMFWLPRAGEWAGEYIWQRCGFQIATAVDFPLAQLVLLGIILTLMNRLSFGRVTG